MSAQNPAASLETYNKAMRFYKQGRWASCREHLYQYLAEYSDSPLYVTCLYYLAYCQQQLGNTTDAVAIYHKVLDLALDQNAFWGEMAEKRIQELAAQAPGS